MKSTARMAPRLTCCAVSLALLAGCRHSSETVLPQTPAATSLSSTPQDPEPLDTRLTDAQLGSTPNLHRSGTTLLAGQPSPEDLSEAKVQGIQTVVNLREDGEIDWDEAAEVERLGMAYRHIPFRAAENLTDEIFDRIRQILAQSSQQPVLLHCASANRVGAVWLPYRVLDEGVDLQQALEEAKQVGLRNAEYEQRAREYIQRQQTPGS